MLQFSARAGLTRAIEVRGLGAPVEFGAFGAEVPQFGRSRHADELDSAVPPAPWRPTPGPAMYTMPVTLAATRSDGFATTQNVIVRTIVSL
ncbi:MAG: hypothetical protein IPF50_15945 [Proteobacteria bacterium]|nr:hypothetical protein [Pseudomonadota bacterium]